MKEFSKKGTINKWLVDNCFGDYYTRKGLDDKDREMDQIGQRTATCLFVTLSGTTKWKLMAMTP